MELSGARETQRSTYLPSSAVQDVSQSSLRLHSHGGQSLTAFPGDCPWQSQLEHLSFHAFRCFSLQGIVSRASYLRPTGGYGGDRTGGRAGGHTDGLDHFREYVDVSHMCSAVHGCSLEVLDVDGSPSEILWSICASTDEQTRAGAPGERADDMGLIRGGRRTLIFMLPDTSALLLRCPAITVMGKDAIQGFFSMSPLAFAVPDVKVARTPWHQIIQRWVTWLQ